MCSLSGKVAATAIMAGAVPTGKIAFLVNTAPLRDEERCRVYYRQLCMATIRLLLFLSSFPRRKPTANVRWCYRLYDSEKARPASKVGLKTESFLELNSASLEAYFSELKAHMGPKQSVTDQAVHSRVLASALGSLVLELPWDKPELRSPTRYSRIGPGQTRKIQQRCKPTDSRDNLVFVMSDCPHSSEDLAAFFHLRAQLPSTQLKGRGSDTKGVFLSEGLSAQLKKCSLSLHWVDTSPLQGKTQMDYDGLSAVSKILQSEEGGILPISSLILPLEGQPLLPNHLKGQLPQFDNLEGQSLSFEKCKGTAVVAMAPNSHCQSLVSSSNKRARSPAVSHAVPSSVWLREQLQPGRPSTQMKRRRKDEICERQIALPLFKPDGGTICFLKGTALTPPLPKETQSHSKLTVSRQLPSTKGHTVLKEAPPPPQAVQSLTSPEIPVQPSVKSTQSIARQTSCDVPSTASSVAVVLAVLPCHEVPLSWLHRTEAYICGGYHCGKTLRETMDDAGREAIESGGSPDVALQDCLHHVKAVTDTVWCLPSEGEEETECGTVQGPHSVSCEAVPPLASISDGEVLKGSTHSPVTTSPLRELIVVVDRSSFSLESLRTRHDSPPQPLTHEERSPKALPSPQVVEVHKRGDSVVQLPPSPPLNTVVPDDPPLSGLIGCLDRTDHASSTCEEKGTEWGGEGKWIIPTSVGSRTFQGLCLMLSRRQLVAVLGLGGRDETVTYAILQPVTSLRATLAHIKPTKSIKLQKLFRREGRPPCRASLGLGCHGDVGGGVATVAASELEIHANLSLLFPRQPQTTSLTENLLQRHIDAIVSSRSNGVAYCLLPWFSLHPHQGISRRALDSCPLPKQPCRSLSRSRALCALKRAYGCRSVGADDCSVRGTDTVLLSTAGDGTDRQADSEVMERGGAEKNSSPQLLAEAAEQESVHPPLAEASAAYTDIVAEPSTHECSSVEEVVTRFREAYSQLLSDKTEPGTLHKMIHKHFSWLWRQLDNLGEDLSSFLVAHVLQTCSSLKEKYTSLTGSPRRVSTDPLLPRELLLQIMLYMEAISASVREGLDPTTQIVSMCIALLPFSDMCPVGKLFQDVVLPNYAATCQEVLTNVYDELMWPLPPALGGDDVSVSFLEAKTPAVSEDTEQSHDSHMTNVSPLEEYRAPRAPASTGSVQSVVLARQHSFHRGTAANKEIALATGKGRKKRKTGSRKVKPQTSPGVTSSKLSAKPSADDGESNINKVKRSLFTRSYSTSETVSLRVGVTNAASSPNSKARKRTRSDENDLGSTPKRRRFQPNSTIALGISCVKETPVKKQVANPLKLKLQRARSKVNVSPDVLSVAETPKRSRLFYTQLPRAALPEGGGHIVKKDPSPESVKTLLHGRLALRGKKTVQPPQSADPHVEQLITDIIEESPSKNSSLDQSLSEDPMVVISCTPLRTSRPKQALLLDTPLKIGAVMQRSANVGCNSDVMTGRMSLLGGTTPKSEAVLGRSVNMFEQADPSASGRSDSVTPVATGFTTPVRRPPAEGGWSSLLHEHTNSPDLFISSPCSGPGLLYNTPTTCTDGSSPSPSPTPIIPSYHWPSPPSVHSQREVPVSIETDSHMAFLMSTPPKSRSALPLSFQGIFPKAE